MIDFKVSKRGKHKRYAHEDHGRACVWEVIGKKDHCKKVPKEEDNAYNGQADDHLRYSPFPHPPPQDTQDGAMKSHAKAQNWHPDVRLQFRFGNEDSAPNQVKKEGNAKHEDYC